MKKLTYLLFLAIGVTACSVESIDSTENLTVADAKYKMQQAQDPMGFYSGNSGNLKGTLSVWNDCDNLYVQLVPEGDAPEDAELGLFTSLPEINNGGNIIDNLEFGLSDATNLIWSISLNNLDTTNELIVFAKAWGDWAGVLVHGKQEYSIYNFDLSGCEEPVCTYGKGYWKNHSSNNPGNQENMWPVSELMLGNTKYSQEELNEIMDVANNVGNNLVIFSQHLIAAKLNVANGAGTTEIEVTIAEADALIGDLVILEDSFTEAQKNNAGNLKSILEDYNEADCE